MLRAVAAPKIFLYLKRWRNTATGYAKNQDLFFAGAQLAHLTLESLWRHGLAIFEVFGGPCRIRTYDQRIKSPLLYQLS